MIKLLWGYKKVESGSQSVIPGPALVSSGKVLEMQICGPHPSSTETLRCDCDMHIAVWELQLRTLKKIVTEKRKAIHLWSNIIIFGK